MFGLRKSLDNQNCRLLMHPAQYASAARRSLVGTFSVLLQPNQAFTSAGTGDGMSKAQTGSHRAVTPGNLSYDLR
jgi:hypothetical protein